MKNIHVLPTDKPSELYINMQGDLSKSNSLLLRLKSRNIYITSDEEIKEGDWCMYLGLSMTSFKVIEIEGDKLFYGSRECFNESLCKKIILTTDQDLINDGVQAIDDEFLEWFVKNPSCEEIEVESGLFFHAEGADIRYKIIIPKEKPKQETLEEVAFNAGEKEFKEFRKGILEASRFDFVCGFTAGAKWQKEQCKKDLDAHLDVAEDLWLQVVKQNKKLYSEEEVKHLMTLAFEQGFKKADVVEAGLEAKETDTEVNWIFLKHKK